ncbi:hypothetical protein HDU96_002790, partial [Phlyctochytrium bullatum]
MKLTTLLVLLAALASASTFTAATPTSSLHRRAIIMDAVPHQPARGLPNAPVHRKPEEPENAPAHRTPEEPENPGSRRVPEEPENPGARHPPEEPENASEEATAPSRGGPDDEDDIDLPPLRDRLPPLRPAAERLDDDGEEPTVDTSVVGVAPSTSLRDALAAAPERPASHTPAHPPAAPQSVCASAFSGAFLDAPAVMSCYRTLSTRGGVDALVGLAKAHAHAHAPIYADIQTKFDQKVNAAGRGRPAAFHSCANVQKGKFTSLDLLDCYRTEAAAPANAASKPAPAPATAKVVPVVRVASAKPPVQASVAKKPSAVEDDGACVNAFAKADLHAAPVMDCYRTLNAADGIDAFVGLIRAHTARFANRYRLPSNAAGHHAAPIVPSASCANVAAADSRGFTSLDLLDCYDGPRAAAPPIVAGIHAASTTPVARTHVRRAAAGACDSLASKSMRAEDALDCYLSLQDADAFMNAVGRHAAGVRPSAAACDRLAGRFAAEDLAGCFQHLNGESNEGEPATAEPPALVAKPAVETPECQKAFGAETMTAVKLLGCYNSMGNGTAFLA